MIMRRSIFLSYARADEKWARELEEALAGLSVGVFDDRTAVSLGEDWQSRMSEALGRSQAVLVVLTPSGSLSPNVAAELGAALALRKDLIPIVAADTPPDQIPGPVRTRCWIEKGEPRAVAAKVAERLEEAASR